MHETQGLSMPSPITEQQPEKVACIKNKIKALQDIPYDHFKSQIAQFVACQATKMRQSCWVNTITPAETVLRGDIAEYGLCDQQRMSSHFVPFVQKKIIQRDAKVVVIGDIHGDIAVLINILENLVKTGYLDRQYNLMRQDVQMVFLGDYINKGKHSIPVMSVLLDLFIKNPDNVVLLRGNHESVEGCQRFFQRHGKPLTDDAPVPFIHELSEKFAGYTYPDLMIWYDYLPMGLYVGSRDQNGLVDYLNFCHAGLELGYNPKEFLAGSDYDFCMISSLDRNAGLTQLVAQDDTGVFVQQIERALTHQGDGMLTTCQALHKSESLITVETYPDQAGLRMGMLWNNFTTQDNPELEITLSPNRRTWYLGKNVTQKLFENASSECARLHAIFRGHQHMDEFVPELDLKSTMLTSIRHDKGVVKQWQGKVYTLGASDNITGYYSFVMIGLDDQVNDWSVRHYFKRPDQHEFSLCMTAMF